ncbi:MAG: hypothetical protein KIS87_10880 [Phycisphaeraceae bacterium]|nr:hypothetical protein [Phycisphaeraceae bacterium]
MKVPVQVSFERLPVSRGLEAVAVGVACRLKRLFTNVRECHVIYASPGGDCPVRVSVVVPGGAFVVTGGGGGGVCRTNHYLAAREAFDSARRRLLAGAPGDRSGRAAIGGREAEGPRGRRAADDAMVVPGRRREEAVR